MTKIKMVIIKFIKQAKFFKALLLIFCVFITDDQSLVLLLFRYIRTSGLHILYSIF